MYGEPNEWRFTQGWVLHGCIYCVAHRVAEVRLRYRCAMRFYAALNVMSHARQSLQEKAAERVRSGEEAKGQLQMQFVDSLPEDLHGVYMRFIRTIPDICMDTRVSDLLNMHLRAAGRSRNSAAFILDISSNCGKRSLTNNGLKS